MVSYRDVLGKVEGLQRGFSSGTCAQAASKAAAQMLLSGKICQEVTVTLKGGLELTIPVTGQEIGESSASCGIIKDSGDDTDITHRKEFRSKVTLTGKDGIFIVGGEGVGTVTREGLPIAPGQPAINPNPLRMIRRSLEPLLPEGKGFHVIISVPEGEVLARETWNPRIGIEGGISIIGTSGIIEPKSSKAYKASIALCLNVIRKGGGCRVYITPGYVGGGYLERELGLSEEEILKVGDHIGYALDVASSKGFEEIFLVGHIGKMAKVASGIFDTHSKYGDARLETVSAFAAAAGASQEDVLNLLDMTMAEASVDYLKKHSLEKTFDLLNRRLVDRCLLRMKKKISFTSIILNLKGTELSSISDISKGADGG
jgi:cobalt-precorrin-5B (C1)-methyltransferase